MMKARIQFILVLLLLALSGSARAQSGFSNGLIVPSQGGAGTMTSAAQPWRFLGDGSEGPSTCAGNISGVHYFTNFTVANATTCTVNALQGLEIYATGTCTIAGTLTNSNQNGGFGNNGTTGDWGGSGGAGGAGAANGTSGSNAQVNGRAAATQTLATGGAGGAAAGPDGASATPPSSSNAGARNLIQFGYPLSLGGASGGAGGSSGGAAGRGGGHIYLVCNTINFTGTIDVRGANGTPVTVNSTGGGGAGGGGYAVLSAITYAANTGTINVSPGSPGGCDTPHTFLTAAAGDIAGTDAYITTTGVTTGGMDASKITITNGGSGYLHAPACSCSGGGISGCTCHSTIAANAVNAIVYDTPGTGGTFTAATTCFQGGYGGFGWFAELTIQ